MVGATEGVLIMGGKAGGFMQVTATATGQTTYKYYEWIRAKQLMQQLPDIKCVSQRWYAYNISSGAWHPISRDIFLPKALHVLKYEECTAQHAQNLLNNIEDQCQVTEESLFGLYQMAEDGAVLVNALNGVLRVTAGNITLEPHSRDYSFTQATAVNYEPEAGCTLFEKTLAQCLPDPEDRLLLQLFAGSILLPTSQHQVCLCSYGPSGTGKSTIAQAIANVFEPGTDSVAYLNLSHICDEKGYYLPKLHRAVLNLGAELDAVELEDSAVWKLLISGESMVVRPIYGAPFAMATTAKLWFLSNNLPRFKHGTDAELRRLRFLAFNQKPTNINLDLKEQLRVEAAGVLVWMIEGLCALLQRGGIPHGSATTRAIAETFRRQNDPLGSFVQEYCELSSDASILKADLQAAYVDYLSEIGLPITLEASFYKNLWPRYPQLQETRPRNNGVRIRRVEGIQLRE